MRIITIAFVLMVSIVIGLTIAGAQKKPVRNVSSSKPANSAQTMDSEARRLEGQYWNRMIKCGGSYFLYSDVRLFEFRDKPHFSFSGQALVPKPLSRVEILNRVDPLPVEWDGGSNVSFEVCRMNTAAYGYGRTFWDGWGNWTSQHCKFGTRIWRAKGKWNIDSLKQTSCGELADWGLIPKPRPNGVIRVDSSKESIEPGRNQPVEQWKPNPLILVVSVKNGGTVFLNNEPQGTLGNLWTVTSLLTQLFRARAAQHVYRPGAKDIETTVWINTHGGFVTESNLRKLVQAIKASGADLIKITDEPGHFGPDARPSVIKNPAAPVQATLDADPALFPRDTRRSTTQIIRVDSSKDPAVCLGNRPCMPDPTALIVQVRVGNKVFLNSDPIGTEPMGTLDDLSPLTRKLMDVFRKRRQQRVFVPGTTEIISTVWIHAGTADTGRQNSLTEFEVQRIIKALKAAGANPIKISDRTPPLTVPIDPNLFPPDQRIIEYGDPKSKGAKPSPSPPG